LAGSWEAVDYVGIEYPNNPVVKYK
jgi:hypothetical protein